MSNKSIPIKAKYHNHKCWFPKFRGELLFTEELPSNPVVGDAYMVDGIIYTYVGEYWHVKSQKLPNKQMNLDLSQR